MKKRFFTFLLLMITVISVNITTYAGGKDAINHPGTKPTEQFLATITRPEVFNETTYKKIYLVCGSTENRLLRFEALVFDDELGFYKPLNLVKGTNTWYMDGPGVFAEQLILAKNGVNQVRIVAYDANAEELIPGKNLQVSDYFITLMEKSDRSVFMNGFQRLANMFSQLFN